VTAFLDGREPRELDIPTVSATVTVQDTNGVGIPGLRIRFRVNETPLQLAQTQITDANGMVTADIRYYADSNYAAVALAPIQWAESLTYRAVVSDDQSSGSATPPPDMVFGPIVLEGMDSDDLDGDGVANTEDNCPFIGNEGQENGDGDAAGDACDSNANNADNSPPSIPGNFKVEAASPSQINVSWDPSVDDTGVAGYSISRDGTGILRSSATSFADTGLVAATEYCYTVTAYDDAGNFSMTQRACATTVSPTVPVGVAATIENGRVTISWTPVENATAYNIYWSNSLGVTTADTRIFDVANPYTHTGLANDRMYYYVVTAIVGGVESDVSVEVVAIPRNVVDFNNIIFVTERTGNWEIYSADLPNGEAQINLTNNPNDDQLAVVSPALDKVAFVSDRDGNSNVYVMGIDGTGQEPLTGDPADDAPIAWSPDGLELLFISDRNGNYDLFKLDAVSVALTPLTDSGLDETAASWSPDGTRITFVTERDGNTEIYVMNADGSVETNLTRHEASDDIPFYSPSGTKIAFISDRAGDFDLYTMNSDGSNVFKLSGDGEDQVGWFSWSPDGSRIAYDSLVDGDYEIYVINANGTDLRKLTDNEGFFDKYASWSADGSALIFVSDRDGDADIYWLDINGGEAVNITNGDTDDWISVFSVVYGPEPCFIATAAYGSYLDPEVQVLRDFRDRRLLTNAVGRKFVEFYYSTSPPIAGFIARHESMRVITRVVLTPVVYFVKYPVGGMVVLVLMAAVTVTSWRRRRRSKMSEQEVPHSA